MSAYVQCTEARIGNLNAYKFKTETLPHLDSAFKTKVETLADEAKAIDRSYKDLAGRWLSFAQQVHEIWSEAKRLDRGDEGEHLNYLLLAMENAACTKDRTIWSRWNTIGSQAKTLLPYKESLPPHRDSLYEVALAAKDGKPIEQWVNSDRLSIESSVRDVKALRKPKSGKQPKRERDYTATVTLCFENYDSAARLLKSLVTSGSKFKIRPNKALSNAWKEQLDPNAFGKVEMRFQ